MSRNYNITIIAGLSAVGKTYVINRLLKQSDRFKHFSAGSLIKKRLDNTGHDKLRELDKNNILANQYLLVEQFNEELKGVDKNIKVLFDAHMIIDSEQGIIEVPYEVFEKINPSEFIFLYDEPFKIIERRTNDNSRKRPIRSPEEIKSQQKRSIHLAKEYAARMSIPFKEVLVKEPLDLKVLK